MQNYRDRPDSYRDEPRVLQFDPANFKKGSHTNDTARVIIKLQGVLTQGRSKAFDVDSQHRRFYDDLAKLTGGPANQLTNGIQTVIHYEYRTTFNGFALTTSSRIAESIKNLPYVTAVLEDKLIKVSSEETNNVIRAQQAWQAFGATGKNIKIGIIDTGIDYTHPDLGQGFGTGFKVVDGYDFVNSDPDPMDDMGHGTHVAGIVAANGATYKGVAPDAQLVAYKVLGSNGSGYDSWILAAIERTVDPDQNPATEDALHIVNMSLGRTPDDNEPLSEAVNNAVTRGVVFCIAAGNDGLHFRIGTPGIAANAITVGATNNELTTAPFSSKGPTEDLRLKPEVAAPGVQVISTVLQHGYQSMDGTSMATPHVAGAVALILEKNPDLTPAMVKSLLMTTAQTSLTSPSSWEQGAGVIDVYKALSTSFMISSGCLDFGLADATASINKTRTFSLKNNSTVAQSFNLTSEGALSSSPFTLTISHSQLTLQPGAEQLVTITLSSSAEVALQNFPDAYTGRIYVSNGQTTAKIESVLMNPQHTDISFEGQLPDRFIVLGIEGSYYWVPYSPSSDKTSMRLYLPNAKYDIVAFYDNSQRILITEGIETRQNLDITLSKSDVKNQIVFKPLDENGEVMDVTNNVFGSAVMTGDNRNIVSMFDGFVDTLYFSDSEHYRIEFGYNNLINGKYYDISAGTSWGISSSGTYSNSPDTFSKITFTNPSVQIAGSQMVTAFIKFGAPGFFISSWNRYPFELPASFDFYQTQRAPTSGYFGMFFSFAPPPDKSGYTWETYDIRAEEGDQISFYQHIVRQELTLHKKQLVYPLGKTIPFFNMTPGHSDNKINYETFLGVGRGAFNRTFGEHESGTIAYHLHHDGVTIKKGLIRQSIHHETDNFFPTAFASPGQYNLDFEYRDFQTAGKFGVAKLSTTFDTNNTDKNPPHLKRIRLIYDDEDTNELQTSIGAKLLLTILDGCESCPQSGLKTPIANIKKEHVAGWSALAIESLTDNEFKADLPALEPGYYVVQIKGEDNVGNSFVYEVTPAFYVGEEPQRTPYTTVNLISPRNNSHAGTTPLFKWSAVSADNYTFQVSDDLTFENPTERTFDQNTFLLESPLVENKVYFWRVRPNGSGTSGAWSSIFRFESKSFPLVELIRPSNGEEVDYINTSFEWSLVDGAVGYQLEISADETFSKLEFSSRMYGGGFGIVLSPDRQYYWRVKAFFLPGWFEEESVSAVGTFRTKNILPPTLLFPAHNSTGLELEINFWWSGEGATSYFFELSKNEDFNDVVQSVTVYNNSIIVSILEQGTDYFWRVRANVNGAFGAWSSIFRFKSVDPVTSIESVESTLNYSVPNPFSTNVEIVIDNNISQDVVINIVDPVGRIVKQLLVQQNPGSNRVSWNGTNDDGSLVAPGIYFAFIRRPGQAPAVIRMIRMNN